MLGQTDDLEAFMFGSKRASLTLVAPVLQAIQEDRCFYCQERLRGTAEVDHFIPWARYPRDTAHNFVLAHRTCNNDKRELLAAKPHAERWLEQTERHDQEISGRLGELGFVTDRACSMLVAKWAYGQAVATHAQAWSGRGVVLPIGNDYMSLFAG